MRAFWPKTCKVDFSQVGILQRETKKSQVFHFRLLTAKSNGEICVSRFLLLCKISEKNTNEDMLRKIGYKSMDWQTDRQIDEQTDDGQTVGRTYGQA